MVVHDHLDEVQRDLFCRNISVDGFGEEGQLRLLRGSVLVVGAGGLGSPALLYLAAAGIGELGIVDGDRVEPSNLQRQILHGRSDVGREKAFSAWESLLHLRGDFRLNVYPLRLTSENAREIITPYDFVIEATDNFETKFLVNDTCVQLGKAFSHAGILGAYGQTMTVVPGEGPCYRCVFEDEPPPGEVKDTSEAGVLGPVAGVLGTIQAMEAIKYIVGFGSLLVGRLLTWDAAGMEFREIRVPRNERCFACASTRSAGEAQGKGG